jgi:ankyrin repeat protein
MRLLKVEDDNKLSLVEFFGSDIPPYAILSHTWGADHEEVTHKDILDGVGESKAGYKKIRFCGKQAIKNDLYYFWVDTCCIDKSSSTELQEAINSMFRWYQEAARCYVYLSDVSFSSPGDDEYSKRWKSSFKRSKWFTRGWTLQELIAPTSVEFFSEEEQRLGDKQSMEQTLYKITGVAIQALRGSPLSQFSVDERMSWAKVRQTKREEDAAYSLLGIFNIHMPLLYGERREKALFRLKKEIKESLKEELTALPPTPCTRQLKWKYASFRTVSEKSLGLHPDLRAIIGDKTIDLDAILEEKLKIRKELLDLLCFEHIDERLLSLKAAHRKTCAWFLHTNQYKAWTSAENLHDHHGFLWIKGKPGAGKSILMKFLDSKAKESAKSSTDVLVASFFFNARGDYLEKSTTGLYRSLLWQLFEKAEDLQEILDEFDTNAIRIIQRKGWQLEILKQTLTRAVECLGCRSLQIFVDALDECDDRDVMDMVSFLEDIGERAVEVNVRLRICFSSRHYPTITIRGMQIVLEDEKEHDADIAQYINSTLKLHNPKTAANLRAQVLEKSAGIFLWVALVIPMLNKANTKGQVEKVQKCLDEIPPGLDDLFEMILTRDSEDVQELRLCIQWILFASRPLKQEEYFFAIRSPISPETARCRVLGDVTAEVMRLFVHSSLKGLAQVTKTRSQDKIPTVQFIHESVRDFFLLKKGYQRLWTDHDDQFVAYSHEVLRDRCFAEIIGNRSASLLQYEAQPPPASSPQMNIDVSEHEFLENPLPRASFPEEAALRRAVSEEFPFLEYAVHHVLSHADAAESDILKEETFLQEFPLKYWIHLDNLLEKLHVRRHTPSASLLYILAEKNLPRLIKHELRRVPHMDIAGERYCFPLFAACANGNQDAFTALLMQETILEKDQNLASQLAYFREIKPQQSRTPLSWAAENGSEAVVQLLLETGQVEVDSKDRNGRTPLAWAARKGREAVVQLLLETGQVDINLREAVFGQTPLACAVENGSEAVVQLLLKADQVEVDSKDRNGWTPLSRAAGNGSEAVVKLLLGTGQVEIDSKDISGRTPLSRAARNGSKAVVQLLLETGQVEVDSMDKGGRTPLSWAVGQENKAVVKLLLGTGQVEVDSKDTSGRTPLSRAAGQGNKAVVQLLLETSQAEVNSKDKNGRTPLWWAGMNCREAVVQLLRSHV